MGSVQKAGWPPREGTNSHGLKRAAAWPAFWGAVLQQVLASLCTLVLELGCCQVDAG